jgi:uncharacterized protein (TIGR03437 family)
VASIVVPQAWGEVPHKDVFATQPLLFEKNVGQVSSRAKFIARNTRSLLEIQGEENQFAWSESTSNRTSTLRARLVGSNPKAQLIGLERLSAQTNYFLGSSPAEWHLATPTFGRVRATGVYAGVDLAFYGASQQIEYDFIIKPGANPHAIQIELDGVSKVSIAENGDLVLDSGSIERRWRAPLIYQPEGKERKIISGGFKLVGKRRIALRVGKYDHARELIIDPVMNYASYYGGAGNEVGRAIGTDASGNVYIAGETTTMALATTRGVVQPTYGGETIDNYSGDVFISKFTSSGALLYVTYLGGSADDVATSLAVDSTGNVYVTGMTNSLNFPTTAGAFQPSFRGMGGNTCNPMGDAFVAKLNSSGTQLIYSTYLGGSADDAATAIAIDAAGNAYVVGMTLSNNFPVTPGVIQPTFGGSGGEPPTPACNDTPSTEAGDAFVSKLNSSGTQLLFSTYLGGRSDDAALAIALDSAGGIYVAGATLSQDFPVTSKAFQMVYHGYDSQNEFFNYGDAFITKLNNTGTAMLYSTYLGGSGDDVINSMAVDGQGNAYVTGSTSSPDFPVTAKAVQPAYAGYFNLPFAIEQLFGDGFVAELSPDGTKLSYSTYLGGVNNEIAYAVAVDPAGLIYVAGATDSYNFPVTSGAFQTTLRGDGGQDPYSPLGDGFFAIINPNSSSLLYSTFFGGAMDDQFMGMTFDPSGNLWILGNTMSANLPVTMNAAQSTYGGFRQGDGTKGDAMLVEFTGLAASQEPKINSNGVVNGASFQSPGVPNSWGTVLGNNLASQTDTWANAIVNGNLPTTLDGVSVTIGGQPAYIYYISAGQINLIVPNVAPGSLQVVVTNSAGPSAPVAAAISQFGPAFFPWPGNQVVATHQDFTLAAKNGTFGTNTIPAKPGEIIILWATGFGPTTPAAPQGVETPSDKTYSTSTLPTVTVGGMPATVYGAALAPGFAGLYQIAIQVPTSLMNGDWPVQAMIGGSQSPNSLVLTVQQ